MERARHYLELMWSDLPPEQAIASVLDVGAGDAYFAGLVAQKHDVPVLCVDTEYTGQTADTGDQRITLTTELPAGRHFDAVFALDVLEHVPEPHAFLSEIKSRMHPGSRLLVAVPAHPRLFTSHDTMLGHRVRYTRRALHAELEEHFRIIGHGSLFSSLLLPRAIQKGLEKAGRDRAPQGVGAWHGGPGVTRAVSAALRADARVGLVASRLGVPWTGLSLWALCSPDAVDAPR